ncbi:hypothetical protein C8R47DRAFT_1097933 [Mycena vitilis]|nr:hypothetical protein C8R47DRAFT_1097933 [Mycena vitilis]
MATQRSPHTPSSIPTTTSRSSRLPTRRPSFSTPGPSTPASPTGVSGFRALRSLLPFGPNKNSTPASPVNPHAPRFASFSAVRKSIQRDRNASLSSSDLPVMVIDQVSVDEMGMLPVRKSVSLQEKSLPAPPPRLPPVGPDLPILNLTNTSQEIAATVSSSPNTESPIIPEAVREERPVVFTVFRPLRTPSPLPELSTIIEADTSGISKHLPSASPSPSPSASSSVHPVDDTSALDLSTTHITSQVLDAIKAQEAAAATTWLETGDEPSHLEPEFSHGDVSFNLSALDPDLAALLSPNRMVPAESNDTIRPKPTVDLADSPLPPSPSSGGLRPKHQSSRPRLRPVQRPSTPPDTGMRRSPSISPSTTTTSRAHTVRRAPPSPLSSSHPPSPVSSPAPASPRPSSPPVPASTPAPVRRTLQSSSAALTSTPQLNTRRPLLGRTLKSDNWEGGSSTRSPPSRPSLDSAGYRPSSASTASTSRTSIDTNRHRPSFDASRTNSNTVRERSTENPTAWNIVRRARKRSMSVDEQRVSPNSSRPGSSLSNRPEWLGPRTAKAFKAAGLLGSPDSPDSNDSRSPPTAGRFGSVRSSTTGGRSDSRLGVASPGGSTTGGRSDSRIGVASPAGSISGRRRGSGSGSYFGSVGSQLMESPTMTMSSRDTPRSVSTAPTSVSGASWGRDGDEIRELKDKHAVETGALLSALSDSQRTSKVLREENSELRERLTRLEAESERTVALERENQALREFVTELREEAGQLKLQLRLAAPVVSSSRYLAPSTIQPFRLPHRGGESPRSGDENVSEDSYNAIGPAFSSTPASSKNVRKRLSSSSSIFPGPPSNMSLLLHEEGAHSSDFDDRSAASGSFLASPTMVLPRLDASRVHRANQSITSVATTSPSASLGSPRSLLLRPEHEVHLGDMDSLDLGRAGPDADEDWSE